MLYVTLFSRQTSAELSVLKQYISWISDNKLAWTVKAGGLAADTAVEISARPISQEPMVRVFFVFCSKSLTYIKLSISS